MPKRNNDPQRAPGRRAEVLRVLKEAAPHSVSIADLAAQLGVHPNTVRFHLDTLVSTGQAEHAHAERRGPGRPAQLFRAVTGMDPTGPRRYLVLAEILADTFAKDADAAARVVEAGCHWGRRYGLAHGANEGAPSDPVDRLVTLLEETGFAPEREGARSRPTKDAQRIDLRHCPFLELAVDRPDLACAIHLGLMRGALQAWRSPVTVDKLDAFVEPDRCVVALTAAEAP